MHTLFLGVGDIRSNASRGSNAVPHLNKPSFCAAGASEWGEATAFVLVNARGRVGKQERRSVRVPNGLLLHIFQPLLLLPVMGLH